MSDPTATELAAHSQFVHAVARKLLFDAHEAADVAQDALVAALEGDPARRRSTRAWFAGVVRHRARFRARTDGRRRSREMRVARDDTAPAAAEAVAQLEIQRKLVDAMGELPDGTVPVTSRSAYSRPSSGAISSVCPIMAHPTSSRMVRKRSRPTRTWKPGIASSLSSVPPVCPNPRPDIMGTRRPASASSGASTSETLSPTPPVECLSTAGAPPSPKSRRVPDAIIARVSTCISPWSNPWMNAAMRKADIWYSANSPRAYARRIASSSSGARRPPSRFLSMSGVSSTASSGLGASSASGASSGSGVARGNLVRARYAV